MSQNRLLTELIRREMDARGGLPFARFMELALYAPGLGYYERAEPVTGRRGDFYTSVSVGSLFGELLAFHFAERMDGSRRGGERAAGILPAGPTAPICRQNAGSTLQIVEAGAHDGRLAADILGWLREWRGELFAATEYWIVEPSARRRAWQEKTLAEFGARVRWAESVGEIPDTGYRIIFCNELLDAMPVHRLGWDSQERRWFEWGVGWDAGRFVWQRLENLDSSSSLTLGPVSLRLLRLCGLSKGASTAETHRTQRDGASDQGNAALESVLPDGYTIEISPAVEEWWHQAAATLGYGELLCFDYGLTDDELFAPQRTQGTLRAYRQHHHAADPLANPGEQDLTAHVNFSALQRAGESARLKTEALVSQSQFLTSIAVRTWAAPESFGAWTAPRRRQFQTLTHPDHLGRAFRVLHQLRSTGPR